MIEKYVHVQPTLNTMQLALIEIKLVSPRSFCGQLYQWNRNIVSFDVTSKWQTNLISFFCFHLDTKSLLGKQALTDQTLYICLTWDTHVTIVQDDGYWQCQTEVEFIVAYRYSKFNLYCLLSCRDNSKLNFFLCSSEHCDLASRSRSPTWPWVYIPWISLPSCQVWMQ